MAAGADIGGCDGALSGAAALTPANLDAVLERIDQGLARPGPTTPLNFRFSWRGIRFAARAEASGERLVLSLSGDLAAVPYSAEDARSRACLFRFLAWLGDVDSCRMAVIERNTVRYHSSVDIAPSFTAADVVTGAVTILLGARPYIEIIEELGVAIPGAGAPPERDTGAYSASGSAKI